MRNLTAAVCVLIAPLATSAQENPLQFDRSSCMLDASGTLTLTTLPMPKGWFTSRGTFDRYKTDLRTSYSLSTSSCDLGAGEKNISSTTLGTFVTTVLPALNPQSKEIAYVWNMVGDLSANQNHWWYFIGCDGSRLKVGCDQARDATFAITAYGQDGQCRTYVDAVGVTRCASDTVDLVLASVQDADQDIRITDPASCQPVSCGIGQCVSERVNSGGYCDTAFPVDMKLDPNSKPGHPRYYDANEKARGDCRTGASCYCKALLPPECQNNGNDCQ